MQRKSDLRIDFVSEKSSSTFGLGSIPQTLSLCVSGMKLKSLLETEFFPFVIRPARYIGNELGSIHKSDPELTQVALAVCELYDRGMSSPAVHSLYLTINELPNVVCERVFAPDIDAEKRLRDRSIPLFSLESLTPLDQFDLMLMLVPGELCLTNLLTILDLAGVGLRSRDSKGTHPIIGAIVPPCFNPEPIADFVDFVILGDERLRDRRFLGRCEEQQDFSSAPPS